MLSLLFELRFLVFSPISLSLSLFNLWRFYTIQTLEFWRGMLLRNVFEPLENFQWLDSSYRKKFDNALFHTTNTFCSLISLVELRQDWRNSQLSEREGREGSPPPSKISNLVDGFYTSKNESCIYIFESPDIYGPGSSIGKELGYKLDGPGVGGVEIFLHSMSRLVLGSTQPPIKWASGAFPGVNNKLMLKTFVLRAGVSEICRQE